MLFNYEAVTQEGKEQRGSVDAINKESAVSALQKRGLIVSSIKGEGENWLSSLQNVPIFSSVSSREMVIVSRQISTLFEAQISALRIFRLLADEMDNEILKRTLTSVADDIQAGGSISEAMSKHPKVFSSFYISMVQAGEESGLLDETFHYLADYLERTHALVSQVKHALVYPLFIIVVFISVMIFIFTAIIPQIADILTGAGEELPIYTKIVLGASDFLLQFGVLLIIIVIIASALLVWWVRTPVGRGQLHVFKLSIPLIGTLYEKLYLARIADTLNTMISSGVPMLRALEVSSNVVDNEIYKNVLNDAAIQVKGGRPVSEAFAKHEEIPTIMVQMIRVGEEGGALGNVLDTLANFYKREVTTAVETLVSMIEPILIITLGVMVGFLLASVLIPIYTVTSSAAF